MSNRTTDRHVMLALDEFKHLLDDAVGRPVAVTLHRGNGTYKIHNVLIIDGSNRWPDGTAGTTASDAYRALRVMIAALGVVADIREDDQRKAARMRTVPSFDTETYSLSLSDCKHWGTPGTECSGPRVGVTPEGVVLCEGHFNQ